MQETDSNWWTDAVVYQIYEVLGSPEGAAAAGTLRGDGARIVVL